MAKLALYAAATLLLTLPGAFAKFVVETNSLVVEFPPSLAGEQSAGQQLMRVAREESLPIAQDYEWSTPVRRGP